MGFLLLPNDEETQKKCLRYTDVIEKPAFQENRRTI